MRALRRRGGILGGAILGACLLAPTPSVAQAVSVQSVFPQSSLQPGVFLESYRFSEEERVGVRSLSLLSVPMGGAVALGDRVTLDVQGGFARGTLVRAGGEETSEISGLTDTQVRVGIRIPGAVIFQLQAVGVLPTGASSHTVEEAEAAGAIASDLLPFRVSNWGNGGGMGGAVSATRAFGSSAVGVSASYLLGREFEPSAGEDFRYRPGDHLRVRGAVDHNVGSTGRLTLTLTMDRFSEDALQETNLYRAGNRLGLVGSYAFRVGRSSSGLFYSGVFHRSQGSALLESLESMPSQQLLVAGGGMRWAQSWGTLLPTADLRLLRTEDGLDQGWLPGVGLSAELGSGSFVVIPGVRGRFGRILIREDSESGVTGLEFGLSARIRP